MSVEHEDIFFNLVDRLYRHGIIASGTSRSQVSRLAGAYSEALADCGIDYKPEDIRQDYFNRL